jgi:hypothetical protein
MLGCLFGKPNDIKVFGNKKTKDMIAKIDV